MLCSRCGRSVPEGAAFCPACGAAVAAVPPGVSPLSPESSAGASATGGPPGAPSATGPDFTAGAAVAAGTTTATPPRYGGFWRRALAFIIDGLVIGAVMTPFGMGLGLAHLGAALHGEMTPEALTALIMTSLFVWFIRMIVSWLYGAGFESSRLQATPGKMLLGLKVTDLEGRRITFLRATGRALGKWVSGVLLGMGYVLVAFTDRKQGLHDLMAGTLVRR